MPILMGISMIVRTVVACGVVSSLAFGAAMPDRIGGIEVDGTTFRIERTGGKTLSGPDLVGTTLTLKQSDDVAARKIFVESVKLDPTDPQHEIMLYHLLAVDESTGHRQELCGPDARGERWAFPLRGQWDSEGQHISDSGFTLTCADGAQGKCVRFGYKPWKTLPNGTRLADYHQACVRMVRADYCGAHGTTRDGMLIDLYDTIGIQDPDAKSDAAGLRFEAAWSPTGAVCVAHTRVPEHITLPQLGKECPRLAEHLGEKNCTAEQAKLLSPQVLLYNKSR